MEIAPAPSSPASPHHDQHHNPHAHDQHHPHHHHHEKTRPFLRKMLGLYAEKDVDPARVAGAVCVVTGANSGVGFETCASLCRAGAGAIFCLGRDPEALHAACRELEAIALDAAQQRVDKAAQILPVSTLPSLSATVIVPMVVDLEVAGEVARAAFSIEARAPHIDILLLCAGRYVDDSFHLARGWGKNSHGNGEDGEEKEKKEWGVESTMAANYYGHALLASMLIPKLLLRAQDMLSQGALHMRPAAAEAAEAAAPAAAAASQFKPQQQQPRTKAATMKKKGAATATEMAAPPAAVWSFGAAGVDSASGPTPAEAASASTAAGGGEGSDDMQRPHTLSPAPGPSTSTTTAATAPLPHKPIAAVTGTAAAAQRHPPGALPMTGPTPLRLPPGSRPLARARIVWVASQTEMFAPAIAPTLLEDPTGERLGTGGMAAYSRSKLMGVLFMRELARRVGLGEAKHAAAHEAAAALGRDERRSKPSGPRPLDTVALHPGVVASSLMSKTSPRHYPLTALLSRAGAALIGLSPRQAAGCALYAATSPELDGKGGVMVGPSYTTNLFGATTTDRAMHPDASDPDLWAACWESTRLVFFRQFGSAGDSRVGAHLHAVLSGGSRSLPRA